jgi:hypothetical protein
MKNQEIGGYLNLNESFEQVFGKEFSMKNLFESKRIQTPKFFYTDEVKKLISWSKFRQFCDEVNGRVLENDGNDMGDVAFDINDIWPEYTGIIFDKAWEYAIQNLEDQ